MLDDTPASDKKSDTGGAQTKPVQLGTSETVRHELVDQRGFPATLVGVWSCAKYDRVRVQRFAVSNTVRLKLAGEPRSVSLDPADVTADDAKRPCIAQHADHRSALDRQAVSMTIPVGRQPASESVLLMKTQCAPE